MKKKETQKRNWEGITLAVVAFLFALSIISYVWLWPLPAVEERDAGQEVIEQTYDADQAINEYEWFRQQHHDIEAQRQQVNNSYDELNRFYEVQGEDPDEWSRQAETRWNRIQQRITGNQNQLEQLVADYNARSDMDNRALFKCHLPYQVDEQFAIRGPPGSDDAEQPQDQYLDNADPHKEPPNAEQCDGLQDQIENQQ